MDEGKIRKVVRDRYAGIARQGTSCCGPSAGCGTAGTADTTARKIGYTDEELRAVPEGANLGLGCGNPVALASLAEGETVLDLGSGAGVDCFLAARAVGPGGRVIGVDMTPEMIEKARENARRGGYGNVEFRLGEIESLPAADGSVDAVISNCVINLSPVKERVFAEAYRVLKPGGRLMISDIVLRRELPESVARSLAAYAGCVAGAVRKEDYLSMMEEAGFREATVLEETTFGPDDDGADAYVAAIAESFGVSAGTVREGMGAVSSVRVLGIKPAAGAGRVADAGPSRAE